MCLYLICYWLLSKPCLLCVCRKQRSVRSKHLTCNEQSYCEDYIEKHCRPLKVHKSSKQLQPWGTGDISIHGNCLSLSNTCGKTVMRRCSCSTCSAGCCSMTSPSGSPWRRHCGIRSSPRWGQRSISAVSTHTHTLYTLAIIIIFITSRGNLLCTVKYIICTYTVSSITNRYFHALYNWPMTHI